MKPFLTISRSLVLQILLISIYPVFSAEYFYDDFEKNNLDHQENGARYIDGVGVETSNEKSNGGQYSLKFFYEAKVPGEDGWAEQRVSFPKTNEIWLKYDLYIPENYYHRIDEGANNNKFLAIFRKEYTEPGFQVNWSLWPNEAGGSDLAIHRYHNSIEVPVIGPSDDIGDNIFTADDQGKWVEIIAHVKVQTTVSSKNGVMQMWKNGKLVCDEHGLEMYGGDSKNYMNELYLLGWSNSGFDEDTAFFIDNLKLSKLPFPKN